MIKLMFAAVVLVAATVPAFADDMMMCDEAHVMKAEEAAKKMQGDGMTMAMKEVDMAKMAMKDGKMKDCTDALSKVMNMKM
ncbi:hypothetical protein ABID16_003000 [Rhizobium aquaticum]|uniref:Pentapeptide MXKDX repeat protein n=1 Tax=Rhizobium aquaticum TaxID=1549636 RepID=A0ABV2J1S0_9HYPH